MLRPRESRLGPAGAGARFASPRELKFGFSFTFFIFLEGLAEVKCRAPHAIDATLAP